MKKPVKSAGFGEIGREFTATYGERVFAIGDVPNCKPDSNGNTIQVIGFAGKTYHGSPWYRFRVVPAAGGAK